MNKKIDDYIQKSAEFAKPILKHFRSLVHKSDTEIEETIKWGMPFFDHKGTVCHMAAFKNHCAIGFWKGSLMKDPHKVFIRNEEAAMGHLGKVASIKELPSDKILIEYIKEAVKLNEDGVKLPTKKPKEKKELKIPDYLASSLKKNKKAQKTFEDFSYTNKKEYVDWLTEAKTESTRNKRLETAIEWMSEGKIRNWKYVKK